MLSCLFSVIIFFVHHNNTMHARVQSIDSFIFDVEFFSSTMFFILLSTPDTKILKYFGKFPTMQTKMLFFNYHSSLLRNLEMNIRNILKKKWKNVRFQEFSFNKFTSFSSTSITIIRELNWNCCAFVEMQIHLLCSITMHLPFSDENSKKYKATKHHKGFSFELTLFN